MSAALARQLLPGRSAPLGASMREGGINFAVASNDADRVELCVFDAGGQRELRRMPLHGPEHGIFHGFLPACGEGLVYGLRAHGPYRPELGQRFNPHKLLLDPWATDIVGQFDWDARHYGYPLGHPQGARVQDTRDNAVTALKARVRTPATPAPGLSNRPRHAPAERILYELHARGFSMQLPGLPAALRGQVAALAHPVSLAHFRRLGVTTLSLLPLHFGLSEAALVRRGLSNYWGYNPLGYFCLDPRLFAPGADADAREQSLRDTVHALHEAGIEVLIDVVFNHTAEGDELGPTLSFRGLDNRSWYRLRTDDPSRYENHSGCGNTLDLRQPIVLRLVMDALRHAVHAWGVDGFRFDLASVLGRGDHGFDPRAPFFQALAQDPLLAEALCVAEPWDTGPDGYQVGRFPGAFHDWNDRFRDSVRGYWLGHPVTRGEFARRFTASSDLFHHAGRAPTASVHFVTAHDGFTLTDAVSYAHRHNEANGEGNRDGHSSEISTNFGVEGPTEDPIIVETRRRVRRALLCTVLLGQGTPMLCAGDELGNSQGGNNNAYCQDNPTGWVDWSAADEDDIALIGALTRLRREHPLLRHPHWFAENPHEAGEAGALWLTPHGHAMQLGDWHDPGERAFACLIVAGAGDERPLLCLFNPNPDDHVFALPPGRWETLLNSASRRADRPAPRASQDGATRCVPAHSLTLLRGADAAIRTSP